MRDADLTATIELLNRATRGDANSLYRLVEHHRSQLLRRIRLLMGPAARRVAESEDFLQQTILEAARDIDRCRARTHPGFLAWLTEIARHNIHDELRRDREQAVSQLSQILHDSADTPDRAAVVAEDMHRLAAAIEELPRDYQHVLELRQFECQRFTEIALQMGRTENAVQILHSRAITKLGALLGASRQDW